MTTENLQLLSIQDLLDLHIKETDELLGLKNEYKPDQEAIYLKKHEVEFIRNFIIEKRSEANPG